MNTKETARKIKDEIKALAVFARKNRMEYKEQQRKGGGSTPEGVSNPVMVAAKITALLNLYHEVRGFEYRHNFEKYEYWYKMEMKKWRKLFPAEKAVA